VNLYAGMWTHATRVGTLSARHVVGVSVMPYTGLMPSMEAIQQAVREPLSQAPREHKAFAVYIFERARQIDRERALARNPAEGREDFPPQSTIVATSTRT
jgi:hypothetical protein